MVVYDTNVLLDYPDIVLEGKCAISFTTLRELDSLKRKPELKFSAQQAIKSLELAMSQSLVEVLGTPTIDNLNPESPDEKIILDTLKARYEFSSYDIGANVIAEAIGVPTTKRKAEANYDKNYTGYITIEGDIPYESKYTAIKELQKLEFEEIFNVSLRENQYVIIDRVIEKNDIWVCKKDKVSRISQSMKPYKSAGILDVPMDSVQMAALDAIFDPDIPLTIIDGKLGTGKTVLSLMAAYAQVCGENRFRRYNHVCVTRPNITTDKRFERGFLPGDAAEKDTPWVAGITSNLRFLFEKSEQDAKSGKANSVFQEHFKIIPLETIQGLSLNHEILLVDEFQLLDRDGILLVLGRIAEGSKVVLIGDTKSQTYHLNRGNEGFKLLQPFYGEEELINFIRLDNVYRSPLAAFVASLMES